ncbi:MAG TPA: POTRA domain-containing protein [Acidobacteriaceae bacterium]|nr:POTRA domain-containing protein [Acidobacteriaceae bacterium]
MARSEWLGERELKRLSARLLRVEGGTRPWGWTRWALLLVLGCAGAAVRAQTVDTAEPPAQHPSAASPSAQVTNALPALQPSLWSKAGTTVTAVRFAGVTFGEKDEIVSELKQKVGEPLDPDKVRADLRRLFASGLYVNISASVVPEGKGAALVYSGEPQYFVGRVTIEGVKNERLASLLEFATRLEPGVAFANGSLATAVEAVKESLAENGFFIPKVTLATNVDDANRQVDATFTINTGPQARVGAVEVGGPDPGIDVATFRKKGKLNCSWLTASWDKLFGRDCDLKVTRETTNNALSGVRSYYEKQERLEGTISLQKSMFAAPQRQVNYDFSANQGPVVRVVVNGVKLSKRRVKLLVPVYAEGAVDIDLLNEGAFNIKDYLQQTGYFDVTDKVELQGEGTGQVQVVYTVDPGRKHKVTEVKLQGNKYFDQSTLEDVMRVKKADAYQRSGRYSAQLVVADANAMEALYRANGFSAVKVTSDVKDEDKGPNGAALKEAKIQVVFTIHEGQQQKFGNVELTGVSTERRKDIVALLSSKTGQPFSLTTLSGDRDAILDYYLAHGFDQARVELAQAKQNSNEARTDVELTVSEGQRVMVEKVLLSGIVHTRPKVVQGQILVHAGDPLDQTALLQTQRNLYNLALFSEVNAAVQNPMGNAPEKNVLVQVTEAKRWDITYGFGIEAQTGTPTLITGETQGGTAAQNGKAGVSPRVSLDVSRINLRGTQDSLTLHTTYGLLEKIATLSFNVPQLFGNRKLTGSLSGGYSNVQNITTFASSTLQGDLRLVQKVKRADTFIYDWVYRRVSVDPNSLAITPNLIPQLSEPAIVGGPQVTYIHDTRDPTPLNAQKGNYFSLTEFLSTVQFGSEVNFNKLDGTESTYYTFGKRKYVFARDLRIGFEKSWGPNPNAFNAGDQIGVPPTACAGTLLQTNPTCNAVPLPERLYVGGATSHRGFGINNGGPRDGTTGYPVGGGGAVVNTFELRMPPPVLPLVGDSISFVLFWDMGNAFQYPSKMFSSIEHFHQPDKAQCRDLAGPLAAAGGNASEAVGTCNFNYYSDAVGIGVRYGTPVGPIRLDFSYNLNPPIYPVFDDYTGAPPHVGQAGHFNFFFSIGQSF